MKWPSQKEREEHWERVYSRLSQVYYEYHLTKETTMRIIKKTRYGISSMVPPGHYDIKVEEVIGDTYILSFVPKTKEKPMEERAIVALKKSIKEKWIPLASGEFEGTEEPECALCEEFDSGETHCNGCPVFEGTGKPGCRQTPYVEWGESVVFLGTDTYPTYPYTQAVNRPHTVAFAKKELEFLRSLLPEEEKYKKAKSMLHLELQEARELVEELKIRAKLWEGIANDRLKDIGKLETAVRKIKDALKDVEYEPF